MITALSIFSFLMLCFNVYLVYDNMHFKIEMRKAYINMEAQRDLITTEMLNRIIKDAVNNEDFELASKAKNLMEQIINNNADYIIKK